MSKQTVEIRGIRMELEVDEVAHRVETFRVGDSVKVLRKKYDGYEVFPGVIVGFIPFEKMPTIQVMLVNPDKWTSNPLEIVNINAGTKDETEIAPLTAYEFTFEREDIVRKLDDSILETEQKANDLRQKKQYFLTMFGKMFKTVEKVDA